jgi:hypothetical protein
MSEKTLKILVRAETRRADEAGGLVLLRTSCAADKEDGWLVRLARGIACRVFLHGATRDGRELFSQGSIGSTCGDPA